MARADFKQLSKVWRHARISVQRKVNIFEACVVSKLLYCLHTAWLNMADRRKLDAFQAQCLRTITGTPRSYISCITNKNFLEQCKQPELSYKLHLRQLTPMHKIALLPDNDVIRQIVFKPSKFELLAPAGPRKRGRPRNCWINQVFDLAVQAVGSRQALQELWRQPPQVWQQHAKSFCNALP